MQSQKSGMPVLRSREPSHLVRTSVAARIVGIPVRTLRYAAQKQLIPAIRIGNRCWYFRVDELLKFKARRAFRRDELDIPLQLLEQLQGKLNRGLSPLARGAR
jgi:DNA-binding transcriptional MerR regulator